jgi:GNAT superfamily N-acetyltransferase
VTIRTARANDVAALADLTTQLGYPTHAAELAERLALLAGEDHTVLVASGEDDRPLGWIHVAVEVGLERGRVAVIRGLVVDERHRHDGIGAALLEDAERWARERRVTQMIVRSRIARTRAHRFYEREGYVLEKTSHIFAKDLGALI